MRLQANLSRFGAHFGPELAGESGTPCRTTMANRWRIGYGRWTVVGSGIVVNPPTKPLGSKTFRL